MTGFVVQGHILSFKPQICADLESQQWDLNTTAQRE